MSYIDAQNTLSQIKSNTSAVNAEKAKANAGNSEITQDAFLQLMMIQMQNQDPMNPMDSSQFLGQQAQFTQVSELQKINKQLTNSNPMMQASSLIGKEVTAADPDDVSKQIKGVVTEANFGKDGALLVVGDKKLPISSITSIKEFQQQ